MCYLNFLNKTVIFEISDIFVSFILPFFNQKKKFCWWDMLLIKRDSTEEVVSQSTVVVKECCTHDVTLSLTTDFQCTMSKTDNYFRCVYIQNSIFASLLDASSVSFCCCGHLCLFLCLVCLRWLKNLVCTICHYLHYLNACLIRISYRPRPLVLVGLLSADDVAPSFFSCLCLASSNAI